jgi:hypothetical protein
MSVRTWRGVDPLLHSTAWVLAWRQSAQGVARSELPPRVGVQLGSAGAATLRACSRALMRFFAVALL